MSDDWGNDPIQGDASKQSTSASKPSKPPKLSYNDMVAKWVDRGYPEAAAKGIADNMYRESGGDPMNVGDGGTSFGLFQHHKERKTALEEYAKKLGKPVSDPDVQIDFADQELKRDYPKLRDNLLTAKDRSAAEDQFKRVFERPASVMWGNDARPRLATSGYRFSDYAMKEHEGRKNTDIVYMTPSEYLTLSPPLGEEPFTSKSGKALQASVGRGDAVESIPTLDMKVNGQTGTVTAQDGRHRALMAQNEGVDAIPVAIRRKGQGTPTEVEGMGGVVLPADFHPADQVATTTTRNGNVIGSNVASSNDDWGNDDPVTNVDQQSAAPETPKPKADNMAVSALKGAGEGLGRTILGGQELVGKGLEAIGATQPGQWLVQDARQGVANLRQATEADRAAHPYATGAGEIVGGMIGPGGIAGKVGGGLLRQAAIGGAIGGALEPSGQEPGEEGGFWQTKLAQVGLGGVAGAVTHGLLTGGGLLRRAAIGGAIGGALEPSGQEPGEEGGFWQTKLGPVVLGGVAGALAKPVVGKVASKFGYTPEAIRPMQEFVESVTGEKIEKNSAAMQVVKRMEQDAKAGGPTAQDMIDLAASAPDTPVALADVVGRNALGQAGRVARAPGAGAQTMSGFLEGRDLDVNQRISQQIGKAFGDEGGENAFDALIKARSNAARPLFEEARRGGSIAPLETQFQNAFAGAVEAERAAQKELSGAMSELTGAKAKQPVTGGNVYSESAANSSVREAEAKAAAAQEKLDSAKTQKTKILEDLRQAQADKADKMPGAIYNPRIEYLLTNPRIQMGINRGYVIERDLAMSQYRPMKLSEYAIKGLDDKGEPIVGKTPTMGLLMVAKEGLDSLVQGDEYRSSLTGLLDKEGMAIKELRDSLLKELKTLNPKYEPALEAWSGPSKSMEAFQLGEKFHTQTPREFSEKIAAMTPNEKEFLRLGMARNLVLKAGKGGVKDKARAVLGDSRPGMKTNERDLLRAAFDDQAAHDKFVKSVEAEGRMFGTRSEVLKGSQTAARLAEDTSPMMDAAVHGVNAIRAGASGNILGLGSAASKAFDSFMSSRDPITNAEIAQIYTTQLNSVATSERLNALKGIILQRAMQPSPPSNMAQQAGNALSEVMRRAGPAVAPAVGGSVAQMVTGQ